MKATTRPLKLNNVTDLQDLVAEYADAVHPGLKVLDSRVLLGGSTVDLLGLDHEHSLVLVVLGFVGDDDMLMRGLEAYSWCLEYPDALTGLYPVAGLSAAEPPLLIFVGERLPDAFLRKVKHLRLPRVACMEFRFGLQFVAVAGPRGTEQRPVPAVRALEPAPVPGAPAPVAPVAAATAPVAVAPRREAPERAVAHPVARLATDADERKAQTVREYLQHEFPTIVIYDFHEHERDVRVFLLQDSQGSVVHQVAVAEDLLAEDSEAELRAFFDRHRLARVLRQAGQAAVSVTRTGLKIERR